MIDSSNENEDVDMSAPRFWPTTAAYEWQIGFHRFLLSFEPAAQLADFLGGQEALSLSKKDLHDLHFKAIGYLHQTLNGEARRKFVAAIDAYATTLGAQSVEEGNDVKRLASQFDEDGFVSLRPIQVNKIDQVRDRLEDCPLTSWSGEISGTSEDLRGKANLGLVSKEDILKIPAIRELAFDAEVLSIVRRHLGAPPLLLDISAWKSFAAPERAKDAQLFHYDLDDYRFCKLFIYLTDVEEDGGPHVYAPGTHRPEEIDKARPGPQDPARVVFDEWYFKTLRKSDEDVRRWFQNNPIPLTGSRGTRFLANTEGLHKGEPPMRSDRWILQFEYGVSAFTQWAGSYPLALTEAVGKSENYTGQILFP